MMNGPILFLLETLACSGVLLAAYAMLLERRVRFAWCRRFLLAAPLLSAVIPLLDIPVWPGEVIELAPAAVLPGRIDPLPAPVVQPAPELSFGTIAWGVYLLGAGLLFGLMIRQVVRIRRLRRGAEISRTDRFALVRTLRQIASFSFFGSIYLWRGTPGEDAEIVVAHEASHIAHRHSSERMAMETMKALLWWNPFVWIFARRLIEVEEFEVDDDVLRGGHDMNRYMTTIFRQQFGYSPEIANGLRSSLTKKRFQMMLNPTSDRYALLRLITLVPVVAGLLCTFSFTTRAAEVRVADSPTVAADDEGPLSRVYLRVACDRKAQPGVLVRVVGSDKGTVTDAEGRAELEVPAGSVIELSYVGCRTQWLYVEPSPKNEVAMFTSLKPETEEPSVEDADGPVYFVNGFMRREIGDLIPDKIKSMQVYKGAAAVSKFGPLGRNGVVVVLLKRGDDIPPATPRQDPARPHGQPQRTPAAGSGERAYLVVETMPRFRGGDLGDFRAWLQRQVRYPAEAVAGRIEGRVVATFVVERDGRLGDVRVVKSPDASLADETLRAFATCPADAWTPGLQHGEAVRVKYTVPVDFRLEAGEAAPQPAKSANEAAFASETLPRFQGGDLTEFRRWVQLNVRYPAEARGAEGRVILSFWIEPDGTVADIRPLRSVDAALTAEAVRVVQASSGEWTPGMRQDEAVRMKYVLPVDFRVMADKPQDAAEQVEQRGRVTDVDGNPVQGAIVRVRDAQAGTVTGLRGEFALTGSRGSLLEISYVGMETACVRLTGEPLEAVLVKTNGSTVDEVVVVGVGMRKK